MAIFTDKVIIVTGASEGIGRSLALQLAAQRAKLVIAARNAPRLAQLQEEVEALGAQCLVCVTDVTNPQECQSLIAAAVARFSRLDVLINNAGVAMWARFEEITDITLFERIMNTNYLGAVYCTYYALPHLIESKGLLVATASLSGLVGVPMLTAYAASKHAMFGFFNSLRIEVKEDGVDVLVAAPDFVASDIGLRSLGANGAPIGKKPKRKGKIMTVEQCAKTIIEAMGKRKRLLLPNIRGKIGYPLSVIAPSLTEALAAKTMKKKRRS